MTDTRDAAKVLIRVGEDYLFSRKCKPGSKDDDQLEMLGGRMSGKESPKKAAKRELAEEDLSGTLSKAFSRAWPPTRVVVGKRVQWVFRLDIGEPEFLRLRPSEESYGFVRVLARNIESPKRLSAKISAYTLMTQKIFAKLGMTEWLF
jgi:hypothetical protein